MNDKRLRLPATRGSWPGLVCLLGAFACLLAVGCGSDGPETVQVRGKITFGGGEWPKPGMLYFASVKTAEGLPGRPGRARFDTRGNFKVTTFAEDDGLIPGQYKVGVECWEVEPAMDNPQAAKSYVPQEFQSPMTSGLELNVVPGQSAIELQWDVPKQ